jgi:peptide-methionine (R)-S-oxide reductase
MGAEGETLNLSEDEWKKKLTADQFRVLRQKGTETAFENAYYDMKEQGIYRCAGCGLPLFSSETKYDSGSGWPSFFEPLKQESISCSEDRTLRAARTEVCCSWCGGHLGHVFDDGPPPTGLRYCMNSAALKFVERPRKSQDR